MEIFEAFVEEAQASKCLVGLREGAWLILILFSS